MKKKKKKKKTEMGNSAYLSNQSFKSFCTLHCVDLHSNHNATLALNQGIAQAKLLIPNSIVLTTTCVENWVEIGMQFIE